MIESAYSEATKGIQEEWFKEPNVKWYDHIVALPESLKITYVVVTLDNQVFIGGFHQYFSNGYGQFALEAAKGLKQIGAPAKAALVEKALTLVNDAGLAQPVFRQKLLSFSLERLFKSDDLHDPLDELDSVYYEGDEDIFELLTKYLSEKWEK